MFKLQLLINGQSVGQPMYPLEAQKWQWVLKHHIPVDSIRWQKVL